jgi:Tol biopolymer transport system component
MRVAHMRRSRLTSSIILLAVLLSACGQTPDAPGSTHPGYGWIAFVRLTSQTASDLYLVRPDGSDLTRLTDTPRLEYFPAWSPDGRQLAFASNRGTSWDIYVLRFDGTEPVQITSSPGNEALPAWSPDGSVPRIRGRL